MEQIRSLQGLRGIAACAVVMSHAYARAERAWPQTIHSWVDSHHVLTQIGHSGVDLFFLLSGFLMTHLHRKAFGHGESGSFIRKRLLRIVPLYWTLTLVGLAALFVFPAVATYHKGVEGPWLLGNFLFLPIPMSDGFTAPIIGVAWTLDYEMYFYALFALAMCFAKGLPQLIGGMLLAVAVGLLTHPVNPVIEMATGPLLLEFLLGAGIALVIHRIPKRAAWPMLAVGVAAIPFGAYPYVTYPEHQELFRVGFWGIPCALTLTSVLILNWKPSRLLMTLGDASYSIYLFQVLALPALAIALRPITHVLPIDLAIVVLGTAGCAAGVVCWQFLEKPLTSKLRSVSFPGRLREAS